MVFTFKRHWKKTCKSLITVCALRLLKLGLPQFLFTAEMYGQFDLVSVCCSFQASLHSH